MTHEEKAKELVDKYWNLVTHNDDGCFDNSSAKVCALIAIDFALKPVESNIDGTIIFTHPTFAQAKDLKAIRNAIELM